MNGTTTIWLFDAVATGAPTAVALGWLLLAFVSVLTCVLVLALGLPWASESEVVGCFSASIAFPISSRLGTEFRNRVPDGIRHVVHHVLHRVFHHVFHHVFHRFPQVTELVEEIEHAAGGASRRWRRDEGTWHHAVDTATEAAIVPSVEASLSDDVGSGSLARRVARLSSAESSAARLVYSRICFGVPVAEVLYGRLQPLPVCLQQLGVLGCSCLRRDLSSVSTEKHEHAGSQYCRVNIIV